MAIKYLKGSILEADPSKRKARILGIAHEIYVNHTESIGGTYNLTNGTKYTGRIIQQKEPNGETSIDGFPEYNYFDDWAYEIDDESAQYLQMIRVHKDLLVDTLTGWDLT